MFHQSRLHHEPLTQSRMVTARIDQRQPAEDSPVRHNNNRYGTSPQRCWSPGQQSVNTGRRQVKNFFILFTFPSASCWISFCNFTGFLPFLRLLTSTTTTRIMGFHLDNHFTFSPTLRLYIDSWGSSRINILKAFTGTPTGATK